MLRVRAGRARPRRNVPASFAARARGLLAEISLSRVICSARWRWRISPQDARRRLEFAVRVATRCSSSTFRHERILRCPALGDVDPRADHIPHLTLLEALLDQR